MARILVLNAYDLDVTRAQVAAGELPDHLLYGIDRLERYGHAVTVVPYRRSRALHHATRALKRSPVPLGDLDQQRSVLRLARDADLVYAPTQAICQTLGYLRAAGAFRVPIVSLIHHPLDRGRLARWRRPVTLALLRGIDAYPALTRPVAEELVRIGGAPERTTVLRWGPDASYYPRESPLGRGVVAAGRTKRDFETLAAAAGRTDVPTEIVCPQALAPRRPPASNVTVTASVDGSPASYRELVGLYAQARAIAVPLTVAWPWSMNGLTSLMDAVGMAKPVIVTRNPFLDVDVERLGIGIAVEPGDVDGWRAAITLLDERPDLARAMGRRARELVETGVYSSAVFARQLSEVIDRVLAGSAPAA